jgi:hypothetical protein
MWGLWAPFALALAALFALTIGLVWRITGSGSVLWLSGAWPGSTPSDGVAMLVCGALAVTAWILLGETRPVRTGDDGLNCDRATAEGLALLGACLLTLFAIAAAWNGLPMPSPQAQSWLYGLRAITASIGLGAWLPAFADAAWGLRRGSRHAGQLEISFQPGPEAMRAGYPWLTAAWFLGAAGSLATAAALWRNLPAEAWLTAAWLLGGLYLIATIGTSSFRMPQWGLLVLTACGAVAALLQAWLAPMLLS